MDDSTRQDLRSGCCKMLKASYKNAVGGKQPHEGAVFPGIQLGRGDCWRRQHVESTYVRCEFEKKLTQPGVWWILDAGRL